MIDQNAIWRPYITEVDYDGITFECYGAKYANAEPEVEQVALKGTKIDLYQVMDSKVFTSIYNSVVDQWLHNQIKTAHDRNPMCFGRQAH